MTRLWIVRAGAHGDGELAAIDQSKLFPGFQKVGDLNIFDRRDEILVYLQERLPDEGIQASQVIRATLDRELIRPADSARPKAGHVPAWA